MVAGRLAGAVVGFVVTGAVVWAKPGRAVRASKKSTRAVFIGRSPLVVLVLLDEMLGTAEHLLHAFSAHGRNNFLIHHHHAENFHRRVGHSTHPTPVVAV